MIKTSKKLMIIAIAIVLVIAMVPMGVLAETAEPVTTSAPVFDDMPNDWSKTALENAVHNGLLKGSNGKIKAKDNLRRAEMATIINRAFGTTVEASLEGFTDVSKNAWYYSEMKKAMQMKTFKGSGDSKLKPLDSITRQEAFLVVARAFKLGQSDDVPQGFSDLGNIASWAKGEVYALINAGYIQGSDGKINPTGLITRAEFAKMMDNILTTYIQEAGVYETVGAGNVMINVPGVTLKNLTVKGDLIIGDGVGDGDFTLDNVIVEGRTVVRGGGENSIIIKNGSQLGNLIITRVDGVVRVVTEDGSTVEAIFVDDGKDGVIFEGEIDSIDIQTSDVEVILKNAKVKTVTISSPNANVSVGEGSNVDNLVVNAPNAIVTGEGNVTNADVKAGANNSKIATPNTTINVGEGVTGTKGKDDADVEAGGSHVNDGPVVTPPIGGGGTPVVTLPYSVIPANGGAIGHNETITVTAEGADDLRIMLWAKELNSVQDAKDAYYDDERVFSARLSDLTGVEPELDVEINDDEGVFTITINDAFIEILEAGTRYEGETKKTGKYEWAAEDKTTWIISPEDEDGIWEDYNTWEDSKVDQTFFVYSLGTTPAVVPTTGVLPAVDTPIKGVQAFTFGFNSVTGELEKLEMDIYIGDDTNTGDNRSYNDHLGINLPAGAESVDRWVDTVVSGYSSLAEKYHSILKAAGYIEGADSEDNKAAMKSNIFYTDEDNGACTWTFTLNTALLGEDKIEFLVAVKDDKGARWGNNDYTKYPDDFKAYLYDITPDTTDPVLESVTPAEVAVVLGADENFVLTVAASDENLYELEVDHSLEGSIPEFSVYASADNPYGTDALKTAYVAQGVKVTYDADEQKWDIDFGETITEAFVDNGGIIFYLVLKDKAGNQWGSMYEVTEEMTFTYTVEASIERLLNGATASLLEFTSEEDDSHLGDADFGFSTNYTDAAKADDSVLSDALVKADKSVVINTYYVGDSGEWVAVPIQMTLAANVAKYLKGEGYRGQLNTEKDKSYYRVEIVSVGGVAVADLAGDVDIEFTLDDMAIAGDVEKSLATLSKTYTVKYIEK